MKQLILAIVLFSMVPAVRAQQPETKENAAEAVPQSDQRPAAQNPNAIEDSPASMRQGHPLDPADVDVLTEKRDRENEAARRAALISMAAPYAEYGYYGDSFWMSGRRGAEWDIPMLPLSRITNPFFFARLSSRGFGLGGGRGVR